MRLTCGAAWQVELLLTLEEFCSEEGVFEGSQEGGRHFAAIFEKVRYITLHLIISCCSLACFCVRRSALSSCQGFEGTLGCEEYICAGPNDAV